MSANDLADRLDEHAAYDLLTPEDVDTMRAAAVLLREQAEQLDTLRNAESVGVNYCTLHHGVANEDDRRCDFADDDDECDEDDEPRPCVLVELIQRPVLVAAGGGVPEEGATDEPN